MTFKWVSITVGTPATYKVVTVKDNTGRTAKALWTGARWHIISGHCERIIAWLA